MRPQLSSRSLTKPRGSKIRACSHSDLGEFLFWWRSCHWGEKSSSDFSKFPSVKFLKIWQRSYSLIAFLAFNLSEKFCKTRFSLSQKNTKMLKTKKLPWQPLLFSILKFPLARLYPFWAYQKILPKEIEENWNQSQTDVKKWRCLSSFNLDLKPWYQRWLLNSKFWPLFVMFQ